MAEAYWVNEVSFWRPDPADPRRIIRSGRARDTDEELSELPHVIVNQARVLESAGCHAQLWAPALA